ncbi:MAG TPA: ATP-dependent Clp protease proteolytic subunit [Acidimicrobiales bacterium]|nr:ATP-dependent Clp protease proteolytic subunit [Acidimicrobiales bacterium]
MSYLVPTVIEHDGRGERAVDVYSRLLNERIVLLGSPIDDGVANVVTAQLLHLEAADDEKEINLYINSPGGSMNAMFAIYDTMQYIKAPDATFCSGLAASAAAVVLAGGAPGRRNALPNARILIHQPHGGAQGQSVDIEIQAREMAFLRRRMHEILARHTGQPVDRIERDTDRDYILGAEEAVEYGLIDHVLTSRKVTRPPTPPVGRPQLDAPPSVPLVPAAPGIRPGEPVRLG